MLKTVCATILPVSKGVSLVQLPGHLLLHMMFLLKVRGNEALRNKDHKTKLLTGSSEANERQDLIGTEISLFLFTELRDLGIEFQGTRQSKL